MIGECARTPHEDGLHVGKTCICGAHERECPACGRFYAQWHNPHYISAGAFDPYYVCTKEKASRVHSSTQERTTT